MSRDNSVSKLTDYGLEDQGSILVRGIFFFFVVPALPWAQSAFCKIGAGVKAAGI
jgi:hypothetical protein